MELPSQNESKINEPKSLIERFANSSRAMTLLVLSLGLGSYSTVSASSSFLNPPKVNVKEVKDVLTAIFRSFYRKHISQIESLVRMDKKRKPKTNFKFHVDLKIDKLGKIESVKLFPNSNDGSLARKYFEHELKTLKFPPSDYEGNLAFDIDLTFPL